MLLFKMNVGFTLVRFNDLTEVNDMIGINDMLGFNESIDDELSMLINQLVETVAETIDENIYNNDEEESGLTMSDFIKLCFILCSRSVIIN